MGDENIKKILLFPGQGSQYVGMSRELAQDFPAAEKIYARGSEILGYDLKELLFTEENAAKLSDTRYAQPAILAASLVALTAARESGLVGEYHAAAGHSLGEYAALVCAGVLDIENAFELIKIRAKIMAEAGEANPGGMLAVIGLPVTDVNEVCERVRTAGSYVRLANHNAPHQIVIAGEHAGLDEAEKLLKEKTAIRVKTVRLKVSAAFHSTLMLDASLKFKEAIGKITFREAKEPFYSNTFMDRLRDFSPHAMTEYLSTHICSPVMFVTELMKIHGDGYETFVEVGPGKVLSGLVKKTLGDYNNVQTFNIEDSASLEKTRQGLRP